MLQKSLIPRLSPRATLRAYAILRLQGLPLWKVQHLLMMLRTPSKTAEMVKAPLRRGQEQEWQQEKAERGMGNEQNQEQAYGQEAVVWKH